MPNGRCSKCISYGVDCTYEAVNVRGMIADLDSIAYNPLETTPYEEVRSRSIQKSGIILLRNFPKHPQLHIIADPIRIFKPFLDHADELSAMSRFLRVDFRRWRSWSIR